jgi:hypothetical protein
MKRISPEQIAKVRATPLETVLERLGFYVSRDSAFQPRLNKRTVSLFVSDNNDVHELIVTGEKWFDKRENVGGGGAIDLVMHLKKVSFSGAVRFLSLPP